MSNAIRRVIINTKKAPAAIGPYNQAVMVDSTMYLSGQIGFEPSTMNIIRGGVKAETRQALVNMGEVLKAAGASYNNVVKATVLLKNMGDFNDVNEVYKEFFKTNEPARAAYEVAALPKGAMVEIEAVAVIGDITMGKIRRVIVSTPLAPAAIGPYNQAVLVGQTLYISGQLGLDPVTMKLVPGGVVAEAARALKNMELVLKKAKLGFKDVIKTTILMADMADFEAVNSIYEKCFKDHRPARAAFQVAKLPRNGRVEIEAVAVVGAVTSGCVMQYS